MKESALMAAIVLVLAAACTPIAAPPTMTPFHTETLTSTPPSVQSPTPTFTPALEPSPTDTPIWTATFCPLPTPEPLWVEPVTSPTDQLSQVVTVRVGYGQEVTITTESGSFTMTGSFGVYANPALVEITLLPNTVHHLMVSAKIQPPPNSGCTYPGYTLQTGNDRNGAPLMIVQGTPVP